MTTLRRQRLFAHTALGSALVVAAFVAGFWQVPSVEAATTEQIVVDRNTGLAIYGFDPVSYFTDAKAQAGHAELELNHGGAAWRFRNEGNRAAFAEHPEIYMPRYGGHDPVAIGRGIARPGHPDFWAIHDKKLYLFYSEDAKIEFELDPQVAILQAEANWSHVRDTLTP
ncbi:MAG: YHS domain-containing (seleno)protein [Pseudorhodoplanes sp.]